MQSSETLLMFFCTNDLFMLNVFRFLKNQNMAFSVKNECCFDTRKIEPIALAKSKKSKKGKNLKTLKAE